MLDAIKPLLESGLINEDISKTLNEAWETKLNEAREQVRAELRDEFAQRYEHDRTVMVEALDKMITTELTSELREFHSDKKSMNEDRVKAKLVMRENAAKFNEFMTKKLAEEIKELRKDRQVQTENQKKLEKFVVHALSKEIKEFYQDKRAVVEAKVKLVSEGRQKLEKLQQKFVAESAKRINKAVTSHLKGELSQLKEDIKVARENNFGRQLFEAFASEYSVTYLNSKAEARKLMNTLANKEKALSEAAKKLEETKKLVESKDREVRIIKESTQREKAMEQLLAPLNADKAHVMKTLLEGVHTAKLKQAFDKYLPAVLNNGNNNKTNKKALVENIVKEVTGDKPSAKKEVEKDPAVRDNVIDLKRLAGL